MSKRVETLKQARVLIERGWTQNAFARDADGRQVSFDNPAATCYCLSGAVGAITGVDGDLWHQVQLRLEETPEVGDNGIAFWNDATYRTKEQVLALIDRVIAEETVPL